VVKGWATERFEARLCIAVACFAVLSLFVFALAARAQPTLTVNVFDDPTGPNTCPTTCSLRQAIEAIDTGGTITLPAGTYTLTQGELDVGENMTIEGAGADARTTIIDQTNPTTEDRVLEVDADLTLSGVTLEGGNTGSDDSEDQTGLGGGILVDEDGSLDLSQSAVQGNTADSDGGGIDVQGTLTVESSTISGNTADGEGARGGGIFYAGDGAATIENSTIVDNTAEGAGSDGGGIYASDEIDLTNDTLDANTSDGGAGTGGDVGVPANVTAQNTIFDGGSPVNCDSPTGGSNVDSTGQNISSDGTCVEGDPYNSVTDEDPQLGPLQNNGGGTDTEAPLFGSPAIGFGKCPPGPSTDQRGVSRGNPCTAGAVEGAEGPLVTDEPRSTTVTDTTATVEADIDPNSPDDTTFVVDYGTTASYGQTSSSGDAGSDGEVTEDVTLSGLQPNTTYHWRFEATNTNGTTDGDDETFTTAPQITGTVGSPAGFTGLDIGGFDGCPSQATVDWGDDSTDDTITPSCDGNEGFVTDSHTYAAVGQYQIVITAQGRPFTLFAEISAPAGGGGGGGGGGSPAVTPPSVPTTYVVQYGPTSSYGQTTSAASAGAATAAQTVTATIPGLTVSSTYHYRFVATSSAGTTNGPDQTIITTTGGTTDLTSETPPPPVEGVSADLLPFLGTVLVDGKPLLVGELIPFGATIDTTHGTVVLVTMYNGVLQTFQFAGGIFVLTQGPDGITVLTLTGGDFTTICGTSRTTRKGIRQVAWVTAPALLNTPKPPAPPPPGSKPTTVRSLWGNGQGHFEVKGRYAAATVRGTNFHVADRCDGTLVHVRKGIVAVLDATTGKTIILTAGKSYLAQ
jgi:Right handed beta helix region